MKLSEPIDIVMVTWGREEITDKAIRAIRQNTNRDHYRLIVIDNDSPKKMQNMLRRLQDNGYIDNLIFNDTNVGLEPARNQGLAEVDSELFICADNDCLPQRKADGKDWVELLVDLMNKYPEYAAISARTQVMIGTGNIFEEADENGNDLVEFPHPGGSFRIMRTAATKSVGGWRGDSVGRGAEERYIGGELGKAGWKTGFASQVRCLHLFGVRGEGGTDRWGYPKDWKPEDTGHSDIWHPVLENGDDPEEVRRYYRD